jgi:Zn finger protein HypA/HybF involved in hydrogenase expression
VYKKNEKDYKNDVTNAAFEQGYHLKFNKEHPGYRPTCCGEEDFIIDVESRRYWCKHCNQEYLIDIWVENWGPDK